MRGADEERARAVSVRDAHPHAPTAYARVHDLPYGLSVDLDWRRNLLGARTPGADPLAVIIPVLAMTVGVRAMMAMASMTAAAASDGTARARCW